MITRDEALRRIRAQVEARHRLMDPLWLWGLVEDERAAGHLDALEALGLIELAPPPERVRLRIEIIDRLQRIMTEVSQGPKQTDYIGRLSLHGAHCILEGLEAAGFEVVRKGGRE